MAKDPYAGLERQIVELPFTEGLANNMSKHFRPSPKDAMLQINNADLTNEVGKFSNRDGFVSLSNARIGPESGFASLIGAQLKLFQRQGELGIIANTLLALGSGAGWAGAGDTVYSYTPNVPEGAPVGAWKAHGKIPRPTLSNIGNLTPDTNVSISDCAVSGNFMLVAWHTATQTNTSAIYGDVFFRVIDTTTGMTVVDTTPFPAPAFCVPARTGINIPAYGTNAARFGVGTGHQAKMQCLALGSRLYVFLLAAEDNNPVTQNDVFGFYIDMSAANPAPIVAVSLVLNAQTFSVCTDGTSIYIAYATAGAPLAANVNIRNASLGFVSTPALDTFAAPQTNIYDIQCTAAFGVFAVTYLTTKIGAGVEAFGTNQWARFYNTAGFAPTSSLLNFVEQLGHGGQNSSLFRPDIILLSSLRALATVGSDFGTDTLNTNRDNGAGIHWSLLQDQAGTLVNVTNIASGALYNFLIQGIQQIAKLFSVSGHVYLPCVKTDIYPASGQNADAGYFIVELDASPSQGAADLYRLPMIAANWASDISTPVLDTSVGSPYLPIEYGPVMVVGGTMPLITLVSTTAGSGVVQPVPITVTCTFAGALGTWRGSVSYDHGTTISQNFTSGALIPLTGPGEGFSLSIAAGAAVFANNTTAALRTTQQIAMPNGCLAGNKYYCTTRVGAELGATTTQLFGAFKLEALAFDFIDPYRWFSKPFGALTAFAGGAMFAFDGRRTFEAGVPCRPRITRARNTLTNAKDTKQTIQIGATYFVRAVYTWLDANGDRWFSAPSYADRSGDGFEFTPTSDYSQIYAHGTSPTGPNITGTILGPPVPITLTFTSTQYPTIGGTSNYSISYGPGTTPQTGTTSAGGAATAIVLTGPGAGLTWNFAAGSSPMPLDNIFTVAPKTVALDVTLPPAFSGMVSGTDFFKNAMEIWVYTTTAQGPVGVLFLLAKVQANRGAPAQYDTFSALPFATITINDEPQLTTDQIYTAGGELENSPAPPCRSIEAHRDRLFAISTYDNNVYYTKPRTKGRGIEWCQQTQFEAISEVGLGIASNETCLMIFTNRAVYAVEGYGPSVTGQPANAFGAVQLISNQVGLYEVNSCKSTPIGVIFRTNQGWWLVDRTLSLSYVGNDIDGMVATIDGTIAINVDQRKACIRIMMAPNGLGNNNYVTYNYWYDSKRWSTDSNPPGAASLICRDAMVLGDTYFMIDANDVLARQGAIYGSSWVDGQNDLQGHGPSVSTGWITVANMAMYKRIWRVIATVENLTGGGALNPGLNLVVYADWSDSPIIVKTFTADQVGTGVQTIRAHLPVQKMKAIKIVLQQTILSGLQANNNNPGYNFIGFGFEIGLKNRLSPEPAARST